MPSNIIVNFLTTQHKASMGMASGFPDVCKTPAPPAPSPVPIPYPNIGMSNMASSKVSKKVKNNGQKVMVKGSAYTMTSGDEAGVLFGVVSNRIKGKSEILNCSFDVKYEGKGVGRLTDPHGNNCGSKFNCPVVGEVQGPDVAIPLVDRKAACNQVREECGLDGKEKDDAYEQCGMHKEHAESISQACKDNKKSVTFRATNTDCKGKIGKGYAPKPSSVPEKTISTKRSYTDVNKYDESLDAYLKENDLYGYVGKYDDGGNLIGIKTDGGIYDEAGNLVGGVDHVPFSDIPPNPAVNGSAGTPYTGDYDAHDMFDSGSSGGSRIMDPSIDTTGTQNKFIDSLNQSINRGEAGAMVQHGPQANYSDYIKANSPPKKKICQLQLPDVSAKDPLLAFDENGHVYKLESEKQLRAYYACKGQEVPKEWDPEERDEVEKCAARQKAELEGKQTAWNKENVRISEWELKDGKAARAAL